jgi:periplasmic protein TonB
MFSNLIESGSHTADLKRKGRFFLGTTAFYILLLAATGVGSIYAYNARLDEPGDYEVISMMYFPPAAAAEPERRDEPRQAASQNRVNQISTRPEISVETPYHGDRIASITTPEINPRLPVAIAPISTDAAPGGLIVGPNNGPGIPNGGGGPVVGEPAEAPPPIIRATPQQTPAPQPQRPSGPLFLPSSVLTGKAISKPAPPYPTLARTAGVQGPVAVQVLIDEQGHVVSAKATSGHPLLLQAAVQAAYQARFTATLLGGQPVKVTGVITYNFVLNR